MTQFKLHPHKTAVVITIIKKGRAKALPLSQKNSPSIDQSWYDKAMRWVDPEWWEKHPNGGKDSLNFEEALKAIMKATGAKMNKKEEENKNKEGED